MKNILLGLMILSIFSCRSSEEPVAEMNHIVGIWKIQKTLVISGSDQKTILKETFPDDCKKKSRYEFTADNQYIGNDYNLINTGCIKSLVTTTYSYNQSENKLKIGPSEAKVLELSAAKLVVFINDNYDYNDDGIDDYLQYTYMK